MIVKPVIERFAAIVLAVLTLVGAGGAETPFSTKLSRLDDRVRVEIDGQLFTEYVFRGADRPYCYPLLAPDGTSLTRDFPMKATPGEDHDHPWHRSLWFAHSVVNGVDFWNEPVGDLARSPKDKGKILHEALVETTNSRIRARNRWNGPDGRLICTDETTVTVHATSDGRFLDYDVTLRALPNEALLIGDNKDGTMAVRVAQWMTLPHKYQKEDAGGMGHIVTANGDRDGAAWGKRADWCDYYAEHNGKTYGVALFDHPQNLRHPTWWMARAYGLFGANPFGQHDYESLEDQPHIGDYTIPAGGSLTLRYRFYFHIGAPQVAKVATYYGAYAGGK
jgi:hypothetical protein